MEKSYEYVKNMVVNLKLDLCCWVAPVRIGLIIIGYFNITLAMISLLGIADDSFAPILMQVQVVILDDNAAKPVPMIAYAAELAFNAVLLAAIYRNDVKLLRVYMKYCIAAVIASILFYSMVVGAIKTIMAFTMVLSILFQVYVLILVRSLIVELRLQQKSLELPTLVMSSIIAEQEKPGDVETPVDSEHEESEEKPRLETVDENPKEETTADKATAEKE